MINGYDFRDPTSISVESRSRIEERLVERSAERRWDHSPSLRIGVPIEYNTAELQPVIRKAWLDTLRFLRDRGHSIHMLSLTATKMALSAYYILAPAEASSNLAKYDGVRYGNKAPDREGTDNVLFASTRGSGFGEEVKRRILLGSYSLSAASIDNYFIKAQKVRRLVQNDFNNAFALGHPLLKRLDRSGNQLKVDVIVTPTVQSLPPMLETLGVQGVESYSADVLTVPASLAGLPVLTVPVRTRDEAQQTVSISLTSQFADHDLLFYLAKTIESCEQ